MRIKKALLFFVPLLSIVLLYSIFHVKALTTIFSFNGTNGSNPIGTLADEDGKKILYGVTARGGDNDKGAIFAYDLENDVYTLLYSFDAITAADPVGKVVVKDSVIYGMTHGGGASSLGTVYSYNTQSNTYTTLVDFDGTYGSRPVGSLILVGDKLYGFTREGGDLDMGAIFSFDIRENKLVKEFSFGNDGSGVYPEGSPVLSEDKTTILGTASAGGTLGFGTVFKFGPINDKNSAPTFTKIADFGVDELIGSHPTDMVMVPYVEGPQEIMSYYGITQDGGANGYGSIFGVHAEDRARTLYSFAGKSHGYLGPLEYDGSSLYGTTTEGGNEGLGSLYEFIPGADTYTEFHSFTTGAQGIIPSGGLLYHDTLLYGLTSEGGDDGFGTLFSTPIPDYEPDPFSFTSASGVGTNQNIESEQIVITGINVAVPISLDGCNSTCSYTGGTDGYASEGDRITVTVLSGSCGTTNGVNLHVGSSSAQFLVATHGCGSGGSDTPVAILAEVTPVPTPTRNTMPQYSFSTTETGTILYSGDCTSLSTTANFTNIITFSTLSEGTHSNCGIRVRDIRNNLSATLAVTPFTIDLTAPSVSFSMPSTSTSLTVPLTVSASDAVDVYSYYISQTNTTPSLGQMNLPSAPSSYTFSSYGTKTLYVWARDSAGNISNARSASVILTNPATPPPVDTPTNNNSSSSTVASGTTQAAIQENKEKIAQQEVAPVVIPEAPPKKEPKQKNETAKNVTPPTITLLDSPVKESIKRNFTPAQVETIEISIRAIIAIVTTIGAALVLASVLFLNPLARPEFILIPVRLWNMLLVGLRIRKKPIPWGTVYDSVTKQPLDPVRVSLVDIEGREVASSITDSSGRYGFAVAPGIYKVVLQKTNYLFPSHVIAQNDMRDEFYEKPYFGDYLPYDPAAPITKNIPLDPLDFDTAAFAEKNGDLSLHYSKREMVADQIFTTMFLTTFLVVAASIIIYPEKYNLIVFGLYIAAFILRRHNKRLKHTGRIFDMYGKPLAHVLIKVHSAVDNTLVKTIKTNSKGRYYLHVPKGLYYIRIERKTTDGTYIPVYSSPELMIRYGTLNKVFNIAYS